MEATADFSSMDTGVLDAEFVDSTPTESAEVATTETETTAPDTTTETALTTTGGGTPAALTTAPGKLSAEASQALASIKQSNPAMYQQFTKAVYAAEAFKRELPGGLKELRAMREQLEQIGSPDEFQKTRTELAGFREYDRQFMTGDPAFVQTMIEAEPNAFQKIAPMILQKFAEVNPEGYQTLTAKATVQSMVESRFTNQMDLLSFVLTDLARTADTAAAPLVNRAVDLFNGLVGFVTNLDAQSKKPLKLPETKAPDATAQDEKIGLLKQVWVQDTRQSLAKMYQEEFTRLSAGRRFSQEQREDLIERFSMRLQKALQNTEGYEDRVNGYLRAGDREGNLRYQSSLYKQHVPRILGALIRPAASPAPKTPTTPTPAAATPQTNGTTRLSTMPKAADIHPDTTPSMIMKNQAKLRDGRIVVWG